MLHSHRMELFACRASDDFARRVIEELNVIRNSDEPVQKLGALSVTQFSDGEFQPQFEESVRGASVYIVQSTVPPADNLMELLLAIDAAKRASADSVVAVIPYFGWARQDRKDRPRVAIGAKLVANLLRAAGADRVMTCELHAEQIQGFFDIPVDHVYSMGVFLPIIKDLKLENLSIAAPDMGGAKKANNYARSLGVPTIICHKTRAKANVVSSITAIGEVEGRDIVIIDDMIDTAGTICLGAEALHNAGAKKIYACCTHAVLSGPAIERIEKSYIDELVILDTIALPDEKKIDKIKILSVDKLLATAIENVYLDKKMSDIYND